MDSSNNIIQNNVIYKNKYGIYVESTSVNNTFYSNDLINNSITTSDNGKSNRWNVSLKAEGLQGLLEMISGPEIKGNHYSDYDEYAEGCADANKDQVCDRPKVVGTGTERDYYPSISKMN